MLLIIPSFVISCWIGIYLKEYLRRYVRRLPNLLERSTILEQCEKEVEPEGLQYRPLTSLNLAHLRHLQSPRKKDT